MTWLRWVRNMTHWVGRYGKPFHWEGVLEADDYIEPWNRRLWLRLRPRYFGMLTHLPCGCHRRFGRIIYFNLSCEKHGINSFMEET